MRAARFHWRELLVLGLALPIAILFALTIPLVGKVSDQSADGRRALIRQCQTLPMASKVFIDAAHRKIITPKDLAAFFVSAHTACPNVIPATPPK